jgi:hypothetical protein
MQVRIASGRGMVILGLCLLGFSVYRAHATYRFVTSAVPVTGTVWYSSKRMFLVEIPAPDGPPRYVPTRMPLLALPWSYVRGQAVTILYDPTKTYEDSSPFAFFPERAGVCLVPPVAAEPLCREPWCGLVGFRRPAGGSPGTPAYHNQRAYAPRDQMM